MKKNSIKFRGKSFGRLAGNYQKFRRGYNKKIFRFIFGILNKNSNKKIKILDIGCGTGKSTEPLYTLASNSLRKRLQIIGCDHDVLMLKYAIENARRLKLPIKYVNESAEDLSFRNNEFDLIIAGTAFHWFATESAFKELGRVLKPGGYFIVFWKNQTKIISNGKIVGENVYKKFNFTSILKSWRDLKKTEKLFTNSGFFGFKSIIFTESQKDTVEELIGAHKTNSKYAVLSQKQRVEFIEDIRKEYVNTLGNRKYFISKRENTICYASKCAL